MKKILITLITLLIISLSAFTFIACGGSNNGGNDNANSQIETPDNNGGGNDNTDNGETEGKKYTIIFETNGGSEVQSITQDYNSKVIKPINPTKKGYTFAGWYKNVKLTEEYTFTTMPSENITLYAKWEMETYKINYELNGGINSEDNPLTYTIETETIVLQVPTREDFVFEGWYLDEKYINNVKEIKKGSNSDMNLYAKWKTIELSIKSNNNSILFNNANKVNEDYYSTINLANNGNNLNFSVPVIATSKNDIFTFNTEGLTAKSNKKAQSMGYHYYRKTEHGHLLDMGEVVNATNFDGQHMYRIEKNIPHKYAGNVVSGETPVIYYVCTGSSNDNCLQVTKTEIPLSSSDACNDPFVIPAGARDIEMVAVTGDYKLDNYVYLTSFDGINFIQVDKSEFMISSFDYVSDNAPENIYVVPISDISANPKVNVYETGNVYIKSPSTLQSDFVNFYKLNISKGECFEGQIAWFSKVHSKVNDVQFLLNYVPFEDDTKAFYNNSINIKEADNGFENLSIKKINIEKATNKEDKWFDNLRLLIISKKTDIVTNEKTIKSIVYDPVYMSEALLFDRLGVNELVNVNIYMYYGVPSVENDETLREIEFVKYNINIEF